MSDLPPLPANGKELCERIMGAIAEYSKRGPPQTALACIAYDLGCYMSRYAAAMEQPVTGPIAGAPAYVEEPMSEDTRRTYG